MSATIPPSTALQSAARYAAPGTTAGALDVALAYDPARRGCDLVWNGGDFALDATPVTNMLMALGCDRRAKPTDVLPESGAGWANAPDAPLADLRRGWAGDALDAQGRFSGSRLWLYERAKATENTRKGVESAAAEALAQVKAMLGMSIQLTVRWLTPTMLGLRASAGSAVLNVTQTVGA